jgi:hypothetical protein
MVTRSFHVVYFPSEPTIRASTGPACACDHTHPPSPWAGKTTCSGLPMAATCTYTQQLLSTYKVITVVGDQPEGCDYRWILGARSGHSRALTLVEEQRCPWPSQVPGLRVLLRNRCCDRTLQQHPSCGHCAVHANGQCKMGPHMGAWVHPSLLSWVTQLLVAPHQDMAARVIDSHHAVCTQCEQLLCMRQHNSCT